MSRLKFMLPALILIGGFSLPVAVSFGKPEYTQKEKKGCIYCHARANSKELNKVGQCYKEKKTLVGCVAK
jgi:hypothetical protein